MDQVLKTACVQISASPDIQENIKTITDFVRQAAAEGARFIATPENSCHMVFPQEAKLESATDEGANLVVQAMSELASELGVWILLGSVAVTASNGKIANRSIFLSDKGEIAARYDKIHLFDVDLKNGESYRESSVFVAGDKAVVADSPWGKIGLSICYDVRFPHLYRGLAKAGASIITVPAAFTVPTGQAHWHTLLRARAIENGAFVIAPGQCGTHAGDRQTYGHSLIIDPWGEILAEAGEQPEVIYADLDLSKVDHVRSSVPALSHDRDYHLM